MRALFWFLGTKCTCPSANHVGSPEHFQPVSMRVSAAFVLIRRTIQVPDYSPVKFFSIYGENAFYPQVSVEKTLAVSPLAQFPKMAMWVLWNLERSTARYTKRRAIQKNHGEVGMKEQTVRLGPREQQIVDLLLQGCDNAEIASQLNMARRTVKAHFNRLFLRFGITGGIKRVKLATLLYRRQACLQVNAMGTVSPVNVSTGSSSSLPKAWKTKKLPKRSEPPNMS
jgi:DNA-binding CsgD family transcriptional regulator